jgi:hypothetical protein
MPGSSFLVDTAALAEAERRFNELTGAGFTAAVRRGEVEVSDFQRSSPNRVFADHSLCCRETGFSGQRQKCQTVRLSPRSAVSETVGSYRNPTNCGLFIHVRGNRTAWWWGWKDSKCAGRPARSRWCKSITMKE